MRRLLRALLAPTSLLLFAAPGFGQGAAPVSPPGQIGAAQVPPPPPANEQRPAVEELATLQKDMERLQQQLAAAKAAAVQDEQLKKQVELLQKQIEIQQKMIQLLLDHVKKQPLAGTPVEKMQMQVATLEARARQAAQRDQELAQQVDNVVEHQDAVERYGPQLPAYLKELFLPSGNNESPLSIYGALAFGYSKIGGDSTASASGVTGPRPSTPGGFYFGEFTPDFLLKLNDWMFLEAEIGITSTGSVMAGSFAQADFFVNDWLTIIGGRFVAPIGFFNERLNNPWINKLPADAPGSGPLLWQQVLPAFSLLGVQATGSFYLGNSPFKLEYAAYLSNGLNVVPFTAGAPTPDEIANLENMTTTFTNITNEKAVGGRIGAWWPEAGLEAGFSAMFNGDYIGGGFQNNISLLAVDLNYRKGNWDVRAEYGKLFQQAQPFFTDQIRREGVHAQVAYRPRDCSIRFLEDLEAIYRFGYVDFRGIDPTTLDLTKYTTPVDVPVRRSQHEFGIDYWLSPRAVLKVAYQVNRERNFNLHDNQFITEFAWGW
jgi:hypothetical protein